MSLQGLDVSRWQSATPNLTGLSFLWARSTYGTFSDQVYATHIAHARTASLITGAYHFGRHGNVAAQVAAFLSAAGNVDLLALDLEHDGATSMTDAEAQDFIHRVHAHGRKIGLYHSRSGFPHLGQDFDWVASWGAEPTSYTFWQYQGSPLDKDTFRGTQADLLALAGRTAPKPPPLTRRVAFSGAFWIYDTDARPFHDSRGVLYGGRITGRHAKRFSADTAAPCTAPMFHAWTNGSRRLVKVTAGSLAGKYVGLGSTAQLEMA